MLTLLSRQCLATLGAVFVLAGPVQAATVVFSDDTFANADWTAAKIIDTTAGQTASFAAGQVASGGNADAYRQVNHVYDAGIIAVGHAKTGAVYDPAASGAILAIAYSYDLIHQDPPPGQAVAYGIALFQGGSVYSAPLDNIFPATWTSFGASGLTAANFTLRAGAGPATPDFSAAGAPITFGYASFNNNTGGAPGLVRVSGIDNWQVSVTSVPVPAAGWLLGTAVAVLAARRIRPTRP